MALLGTAAVACVPTMLLLLLLLLLACSQCCSCAGQECSTAQRAHCRGNRWGGAFFCSAGWLVVHE
jgi:hypothetical protein